MGLIFVVVSTVFATELFMRLSFLARTRDLVAICRNTLAVLRSRKISDHWKEIAILAYAMKLLAASSWLLCVILIVLSPIVISILLGDAIGIPIMALFVRVLGLIVSIMTATIYLSMRRFVFK